MTLTIQCLVIDTHDPDALASFWEAALGWRRTYDKPHEVVLEPPVGSPQDGVAPDLLFGLAEVEKSGKNRLHLDLRPTDRDAEVARLLELGATHADVGQTGEESWVVLADPDGNEFCVLRAFNDDELAQIAAEAEARETS